MYLNHFSRRRNEELNKHKESIFSAADELMKKYPSRLPSQNADTTASRSDLPLNAVNGLRSALSLVDDEYDRVLATKSGSRPPTSRLSISQSNSHLEPSSSQIPNRRPSGIPNSAPIRDNVNDATSNPTPTPATDSNPDARTRTKLPVTRPDSAIQRERPSSRPPSARPMRGLNEGSDKNSPIATNPPETSNRDALIDASNEKYENIDDMPLDGVNAQAVIRFQKAKIQSLETTIASLTSQMKTQQQDTGKNNDKIRALNEENIKIQKKLSACESVLAKYKQTANEAKQRVDELEKDASNQKKEIEKLISQRIKLTNDAKQQDAKLTRALVELEKAKSKPTESVPTKDKDSKVDVTRLEAENRRLLQQKNDLLTAMKKQYKLIAILKKQIVHLEASRLIQFTEQDFVKAMQSDQ